MGGKLIKVQTYRNCFTLNIQVLSKDGVINKIIDMGIDYSSLGFDSSMEMRDCKVDILKERLSKYIKIGMEKGLVIEIILRCIESFTLVEGLYEVRTISGNIFYIDRQDYIRLRDILGR